MALLEPIGAPLEPRYQIPGTRYPRYQVPGISYQVPGTRYQVPSIRYQVPITYISILSNITLLVFPSYLYSGFRSTQSRTQRRFELQDLWFELICVVFTKLGDPKVLG